MMLTPAHVIAKLKQHGYAMTPRRLGDWREKGLLPPLVAHGKGRGQGWIYGWEDALVVEQAIAVEELLAWHSRTDWLYVPLWCLGFSVPPTRIRPRLLAIVNAHLDYVAGDALTREDVADHVSRLSVEEAKEYRRQRTGRPGPTAEALEYWLNMLAGRTAYAPNNAALVGIVESLANAFGGPVDSSGTTESKWSIQPSDLRRARRWASQNASLPLLRDANIKATDEDMQRVHDDWRAIAQLERTLSRVDDDDAWADIHFGWMRIVAVLGPWLSLVDLSLRRRGLGPDLESTSRQIGELVTRLEYEPTLRSAFRDAWDEVRERTDETRFGEAPHFS